MTTMYDPASKLDRCGAPGCWLAPAEGHEFCAGHERQFGLTARPPSWVVFPPRPNAGVSAAASKRCPVDDAWRAKMTAPRPDRLRPFEAAAYRLVALSEDGAAVELRQWDGAGQPLAEARLRPASALALAEELIAAARRALAEGGRG